MFGTYLRKEYPSARAVVVTGDIGEAHSFSGLMERFASTVGAPVYFVLGNHDAYGGSVSGSKKAASRVGKGAHYLPRAGIIAFGETALVGQDGWYDGRLGKGAASAFLLRDFNAVKELRERFQVKAARLGALMPFFGSLTEEARAKVLGPIVQAASIIADTEANAARDQLRAAVAKGFRKIVFATHVPPFAGSAWHEGQPSDEHALPWFASKTMGEALLEVVTEAPGTDFLVLCGHSHSPGEYQAAPNMRVLTGKAVYRSPEVAAVFEWA
jgi:3',5'-cyclic AMP phosphodiesterase CpdA